METFFCRSNLSVSTIYVPVLTEKANEKNMKKPQLNGFKNEHFFVPPWRSKGTIIKSHDHKLKIDAASYFLFTKKYI